MSTTEQKETLVPESNLGREARPGRWTVRRDVWFKNNMSGNPLVYTDRWEVTYEDEVQFYGTHAI